MSGTVLAIQELSPRPGQQRSRNAQVSHDMQERRRHLLGGAESTMQQIKQIRSYKMYEEHLRQSRAGDQPSGNSSFAEAFSSLECDQALGSSLRPADGKISVSFRADGYEHLRTDPGEAYIRLRRPGQELHVPTPQSNGSYAQKRYFPSRHKAGKHPHHGRKLKARGFGKLSRCLFKAAIY